MKIDLRVLEHLGLKMYGSLPLVVAEYVANCWDAGATVVQVTIPDRPIDEQYTMSIDDNGVGMTKDEVNDKFLVVGRNRRVDEGTDEVKAEGKRRRVMGRKGLGKLAGFGVAGRVVVLTRRNGEFIEFCMDYDRIQRKLEAEEAKEVRTRYKPEVLNWGSTDEPNGTSIRLMALKRERSVVLDQVRRHLARSFSVLAADFVVNVNGEPVIPAERELKENCEWVWPFKNVVVDETQHVVVNGWIGTMKGTVPQEVDRGVVVMARGKLVQTASTFGVGGKGVRGQVALSYLVGEIHAEFLDAQEDFVVTGRRTVVWEMEPAATLYHWLSETIKHICSEWVNRRREKKMKTIRALPVYEDRISNLPTSERRIIDGFLGKLAESEEVEEETIVRVANFLASGVEYKGFLDMVQALEEAEVAKPEVLIHFFDEWEVLDAIETIKIVEGRVIAVGKFHELVTARAKEVPTLHNFLVDNPWLLDPTWDYLQDELELRKFLLQKFPERKDIPEDRRRIDFLCLGYGNELNIIELKRPGVAISRDDLNQLESYVDAVRTRVGTDPGVSYQSFTGYLIGDHLSGDAQAKAQRLKLDRMFVRTYSELRKVAQRVHRRFIEVLERKADRIKDPRLLEGLTRLREGFEGLDDQGKDKQA